MGYNLGFKGLKKKDSKINPLKPKVHLNNIKKGRPYLKEISISITKTNQLMLFREITIVYFENHMKHITEWKRWRVS